MLHVLQLLIFFSERANGIIGTTRVLLFSCKCIVSESVKEGQSRSIMADIVWCSFG